MATKQVESRKPATAKPDKAVVAAKAKAEAEAKAKNTATERKLAPLAKEINAALDKANVAEGRASDLRLTAACKLAEAKAQCDESGMAFKAWCEANVQQSYNTCRELAVCGASDDPKLALEDLRAKAAKRMKQSRDKAKTAKASSAGRVTNGKSLAAPTASPYVATLGAVSSLPETDRVKMIKDVASDNGFAVVTKEQAKRISEEKPGTIGDLKAAIGKLSAKDRVGLLRWLTEAVNQDAANAGFTVAAENAAAPEPGEIPGFLDRRTAADKAKARKAKVSRGAVA